MSRKVKSNYLRLLTGLYTMVENRSRCGPLSIVKITLIVHAVRDGKDPFESKRCFLSKPGCGNLESCGPHPQQTSLQAVSSSRPSTAYERHHTRQKLFLPSCPVSSDQSCRADTVPASASERLSFPMGGSLSKGHTIRTRRFPWVRLSRLLKRAQEQVCPA